MPIHNYREDEALIHVQVNGVSLDNQPWDKMEGGVIEAQNVNYNPGVMAPAIDLGGPTKRTDVTVHRLWTDSLVSALIDLENAVGKATMAISATPLDADGNTSGQTHVITGILKSVTRPPVDSNASAAAVLQLVMGANQHASAA